MFDNKSALKTRSFRRDKIWWLITFSILLSAVGYGLYWHNNPENQAPPLVQGFNYNPRVLILALDRVVRKPDNNHVSATMLENHLTTLSNHGFEPITVRALHDFYYHNKALPEKPVLLTFDYGYMDSYTLAHPVLVKTGWRAAIALTTIKQQEQDTHYLYWDRLQRMLNSEYWEILTHGNNADLEIVTNQLGEVAPFAASAMWRQKEGRLESADEFFVRITDDIKQSKQIIKDELDFEVLGYVYRYATPERIFKDPYYMQAEFHTRQNAGPLSFIDDDFGVNDHSSDPHDLRRLRVSPHWSTREFMQRVQTSLNFPEPGKTGIPNSKHWVSVEGNAEIKSNSLKIDGTPRSMTWLSGSQWNANWTLEANIKVSGGDFWFVQNDKHGSQWRFGGNDKGVYLKLVDHDTTTRMLRTNKNSLKNAWVNIKIVRRGGGIWVEWNGTPLWKDPVHLPGSVYGPIGLLTWKDNGESAAEIQNIKINTNQYIAKVIPPFPSASEVKSLINFPQNIAALSPTQFTLTENQLHEHNVDSNLLKLLQHRYGWQITPTIKLNSNIKVTDITKFINESLVHRANKENWGGLHLDISSLSHAQQNKLSDTIFRTNQFLRRDKRLLLVTQSDGQTPQALKPRTTQFALRN